LLSVHPYKPACGSCRRDWPCSIAGTSAFCSVITATMADDKTSRRSRSVTYLSGLRSENRQPPVLSVARRCRGGEWTPSLWRFLSFDPRAIHSRQNIFDRIIGPGAWVTKSRCETSPAGRKSDHALQVAPELGAVGHRSFASASARDGVVVRPARGLTSLI
jgi:hypothetical protein